MPANVAEAVAALDNGPIISEFFMPVELFTK